MAFLTINGKEYKAKVSFDFARRADDKYKQKQGDNELSGLESIYQNLLAKKTKTLAEFWDCAVHVKKGERPSIHEIEEALEEKIEEDEEAVEQLFGDAYKAMDQAGFFRPQRNEFWKNIETVEKMAKDEKEKEQFKEYKKQLKAKHKELTA